MQACMTINVIHRSSWAVERLQWLLLDQTRMLLGPPLRLPVSKPTMQQTQVVGRDVVWRTEPVRPHLLIISPEDTNSTPSGQAQLIR